MSDSIVFSQEYPDSICVHKDLELSIRRSGLDQDLANEVRMMFLDFLSGGTCSFNRRRIKYTYGSSSAQKVVAFMLQNAKMASKGRMGARSAQWVFNLDGISRRPEGESGWYWISKDYAWWVQIDKEWIAFRSQKWLEFCEENNLEVRRDAIGATKAGRAVLEGLKAVRFDKDALVLAANDIDDEEKRKSAIKQVERLGNASPCVSRKRYRLYHAATNIVKRIREKFRMAKGGSEEPMAIADLHASYFCNVASKMQECEEKNRVIELLQAGEWYKELSRISGQPVDSIKSQANKQLLFWKDPRLASRPIWVAFRQAFPVMARTIMRMRKDGASAMSDRLMNIESSVFIDGALVRLFDMGIRALPYHDAIAAAASDIREVVRVVKEECKRVLGFVPLVKC